MNIKLIRALTLWAATLVSVLLSLLPATMSVRIAAMTGVVLVVVGIWILLGRRLPECATFAMPEGIGILPPKTYRKPVVLVCGDGLAGLFGPHSSGSVILRVTERGCYISVPQVDRIPSMVSSLLAIRPNWRGQLSVMFVVMPQEHSERGVLAGQIRALCHQIAVVRRRAIALPMMLVSYLQAQCCEEPGSVGTLGRPLLTYIMRVDQSALRNGNRKPPMSRGGRIVCRRSLNSTVSWPGSTAALCRIWQAEGEIAQKCPLRVR